MTSAPGRNRRREATKAAVAARRHGAVRGAPKAAPTRRYDPEDTRTRILESAYQLFAMRGYSMTGTADIAAQAGVSEGSIFYHFGSKHSLLVELGRLHGQKLVAAMQGGDTLDQLTLATSLGRAFDFIEANHLEGKDGEDCAGEVRQPGPEVETFFEAAKEIIVDWTKLQLECRHGASTADSRLTAQLIFAVVGEAARHYCTPGCSSEDRLRIRSECVRFCSAAVGEP